MTLSIIKHYNRGNTPLTMFLLLITYLNGHKLRVKQKMDLAALLFYVCF